MYAGRMDGPEVWVSQWKQHMHEVTCNGPIVPKGICQCIMSRGNLTKAGHIIKPVCAYHKGVVASHAWTDCTVARTMCAEDRMPRDVRNLT